MTMVDETAPATITGAVSTTTASVETTAAPVLVLTLRDRPAITWTDDTVDNEHLGRKSSKRCCIFHKVKKFAESDSDETDEDAEGGDDEGKESPEGAEDKAGVTGVGRKKTAPIKNYQRHHA